MANGPLLAGVVGYPIGHSLSPEIFRILSKKTGIPLEYRKIEILPERFSAELESAGRKYHGWNVTIPHKEKAARELKKLDASARALGAVNVIRFRGGMPVGHNTDVIGFRETLKRCGFSCRGKTAVVYGAGGGAAATLFALGLEGIGEIVLVNRTPSRSRALIKRLRGHFSSRTKISIAARDAAPADADLYVNATPLGMKGFPSSPKLPRLANPENALVFDLVYRPLETQFLRSGHRQGARTVNGLDMLVAQAIATWEIWIGKLPKSLDRAKLQKGIQKALERKLRKPSGKRGGKRK